MLTFSPKFLLQKSSSTLYSNNSANNFLNFLFQPNSISKPIPNQPPFPKPAANTITPSKAQNAPSSQQPSSADNISTKKPLTPPFSKPPLARPAAVLETPPRDSVLPTPVAHRPPFQATKVSDIQQIDSNNSQGGLTKKSIDDSVCHESKGNMSYGKSPGLTLAAYNFSNSSSSFLDSNELSSIPTFFNS